MHRALLLSLLVLGFGASAVWGQFPSSQTPNPPRQHGKPAKSNRILKLFSSGSSENVPAKSFIIRGDLQPKNDPLLRQDAALENALEKAKDQFVGFLHDQKLGSHWEPGVPFIREHMLADLREDELTNKDPRGELKDFLVADRYRAFEETRTVEEKGKETECRRVWIKLAINSDNWKLIQKEVRQAEEDNRLQLMRTRMVFLVKLLAGLVALLATICGYLRLDEWSKGYYTKWLRLAAVGCVGAVTVFLWFLVAR